MANGMTPKRSFFPSAQYREQLDFVACRIGSQSHIVDACGQLCQRIFENTKLLITGWNVAVSKLRAHNELLLGPPDVQWLIRLETPVAKQGLAFVSLIERCIHVEGGGGFCLVPLHEGDNVVYNILQTLQCFVRLGNERLALATLLFLFLVVKLVEKPEYGRW